MPAVLETPEVVEREDSALAEAPHLSEAPPQVRPARAGFWQRVAQSLRRHRVHRCHRPPSFPCSMHTCEGSADLLACQYPTLFIQAYAGI
jgi:hypothetical protein